MSAVAGWTVRGRCVAHSPVGRGGAGSVTVDPEATAVMCSEEQVRPAVGVRDVDFLDHPDGTIE
ncbi:hypothetical protein [Streptomyces puniciscabiei]|uniref:hypothetical protein n=1 Tax=Streptomyces puniciscabiei TaxID=164348 RepID=UPI0006EB82D8|nr:hypothetical protein [Streptomyces puniciscabiei]